MTTLSLAAQAVMIAATNGNFNVVDDPVYKQCIAAALRAVADEVLPSPRLPFDSCCEIRSAGERVELLAIAAELESQ